MKKTFFCVFKFCIFWCRIRNFESEIHFRWPEPEKLDSLEKTKISGLSGFSGAAVPVDEIGYRI